MGCDGCSSKKAVNGIPLGCNNNGACQTGGCGSILDVHDWLANVYYDDDAVRHNIVEVKFKGTRKEYYKNPNRIALEIGDAVAVESAMYGYDVGYISLVGDLVQIQLKKNNLTEDSPKVRKIMRKATDADIIKYEEAKGLEKKTMMRAREFALELGLVMKISDVEYQGDKSKATFFYTADGRVDFRELIKTYAREFKVKVEMKQIGLRQEAGRLGGIGSCGRELCCSTWLTDFNTVPTTAAKYQNLFLNPLKLSGQCGRLKCCLNYELDTYLEAIQEFPAENLVIRTDKGLARIEKQDILQRVVWFRYMHSEEQKMYPIELDKVWEMIATMEEGGKVADLDDFTADETIELGFKDMVGEDNINRFASKSNKKPNNRNRNNTTNRGDKYKAQAQQNRGPIKLVDDSAILLNMNQDSFSKSIPDSGNRNPRPNSPNYKGNNPNNRGENRTDNRTENRTENRTDNRGPRPPRDPNAPRQERSNQPDNRQENKPQGQRPPRQERPPRDNQGENPTGNQSNRPQGERPHRQERPPKDNQAENQSGNQSNRPQGERPPRQERPPRDNQGENPTGNQSNRSQGERPPRQERPPRENQRENPTGNQSNRPQGERPPRPERPPRDNQE